ncbi:patatin-domain-containing protein [Laetiporus sulphureus 93-53]|uniref:Lysophospholipase NTE1 n=1 Tax=Laetiporus sulphureus 93-53 TaxID=1314785 RepID=A0A165F832_9APHY|nr:patatin-domain-containing protein [Laetiporus sulphureus 93-53]KZT08570.1 patatin-domain-containing protein [Laetiporus sulphureus 93-53]
MDASDRSVDYSRHPLVMLISAFFWVILWMLSCIKALAAFVTITIPRWIYAILSYSMTLTLNFWSFAIMFVLSAVALNYWIRFRYLNTYTKLKEPPLIKADAQELNPDVNTPDHMSTFHNYLDEFLQAVRVFGFLEKPVFHELARHLQTRRLIAGDTLSLDQDKSFYCVIDGSVQVYARTGLPSDASQPGAWDEEDMNGYQLLNEVGSGGMLSSLFTILSLFTENVKLSWRDVDNEEFEPVGLSTAGQTPLRSHPQESDSDVSNLDLPSPVSRARRPSISSSGSTIHPDGMTSPLYRSSSAEFSQPHSSRRSSSAHPRASASTGHDNHYSVVARAVEDSSLAVIPAEAFRGLTKKFPKATAHIVQVILTRFSRVTFNAAHNYLGLTTEVLRTEKAINELACHPLPQVFYESGLRQLRQRFDSVPLSAESDTESDYFSPPSSSENSSRTSLLPQNVQDKVKGSSTYQPPALKGQTLRQMVQAGDLLTSTGQIAESSGPPSRRMSTLYDPRTTAQPRASHINENQNRIRRMSADEFDLREEVMSCIAKSIGLLQPPISGEDSVETSPVLSPSDTRSGPPKSSFGSLTLLQMGDDTASSMTGMSSTLNDEGHMSGLDNEVEILFFPAGSVLAKAGERNTGLFYVIEGFLDILLPPAKSSAGGEKTGAQSPSEDEHPMRPKAGLHRSDSRPWSSDVPRSAAPLNGDSRKPLFTIKPGGIAGYLSSLCQIASYVDIVAKTDTYVGFLPSPALDRLLEKRPIVLLTLAKRLISLLSPIVLHIDGSLDWMQVDAGQVLWRPNDTSDSFYIVINGRLRAIVDKEGGGISILAEYGQGDTVGELDVITGSPRRNTVHAIRDTELIRMPRTLFNAISSRNPRATAQILQMIASRVRTEVESFKSTPMELSRSNTNLKTVAVLPVSRNVPLDAFARKLHTTLESIGAPTSYLNQASMSNHLGRHAFSKMGKLKAAGWLTEQEQKYRLILYVADSAVSSSWTQTCIRQADCVLVVGMGDDPSIGEYERLLLSLKTTARKELILLHPDRSVVPGSTRQWLKNRPWVHQHFHVELPGLMASVPRAAAAHQDPAAITALRTLRDKVQSGIKKYRQGTSEPRPQRSPHTSDFARLARRLCGKSVGVVLGGGGARGISHLGVLRALEESGIPIDLIGGTSMGAFVGGLYAREGDAISSAGRTKQFSSRMGNVWRMLSDVTYPIVAYTTGHEFNRSIYKAFYDLHIEDMWLPFFCNSTNINTSRMEIHETGFAWRFIRASMTLVGLLPPLCDNGNMLVDGGYIDNLPVSAMLAMGASAVIASDVGSLDDNSPRNFGDSISGWWLLINRWNPFSNARNIPAITELQSRLAYVSSVKTLEEVKVMPGCLYMGLPVQEFGTLQFGRFEEIQKKGYEAAVQLLEKWGEEGRLPSAFVGDVRAAPSAKTRGKSARRNSI